ncbi:MAG: hypothetical protein COW30_17315 [Rhodospirillales bacterium CG15_BIG_FIL_POST_REV_8_21_14_020_66_15]|nr:MAG: hypothetical protein COW30_17315 [Rhodospirillales bacterium CG15_BIG_FIL_POST_REV_8_21_14_020_66_15]
MPVRLPAARLGVKMRKSVLVVGACALLGGCALPVPIQIASWAIDIISVATTEKSVTDHGISALTHKDCALYRVVTEEDSVICRDVDERKDVMTADAGTAAAGLAEGDKHPQTPQFDAVEAQVAKSAVEQAPVPQAAETPAAFETAAGGEQAVTVNIDIAALQPVSEEIDRPFVRFAQVSGAETAQTPAVKSAAVPPSTVKHGKPQAGFYYVIGSFRGGERAKQHMQTYSALVPAVLHGKIGRDGRDVYRVVVGPFKAQERTLAYRRIKRAGIADTWAIRVSPKDWSVAAKTRPLQQADASAVLGARDWPGLAHFISAR